MYAESGYEPYQDSSTDEASAEAGPDAMPDVVTFDAPDVAEEPTIEAGPEASTDVWTGPGIPCPCEYSSQCECTQEPTQTYPFEVTEAIPYQPSKTVYVVATCPPGETRSDGLNNCWPEGDVQTMQPGWPDGANGWRCAAWYEPQCAGCPVPHGTLTTRTRCQRSWCEQWAPCQ